MFCVCCDRSFESDGPLEREGTICPFCGSTSRDRYMTLATLGALAQLSRNVSDRPIRVIGVSDSAVLSSALRRKFGEHYRNYQFHEEPFLDLSDVAPSMYGTADIVTCSEVLEHVPNPVSGAFRGLASLLVPGGIAVVSVPHLVTEPHEEHFPPMVGAFVDRSDPDHLAYVGVDQGGTKRRFTNLVFHGGEGATLEHRVYNVASLSGELAAAGFSDNYPLMRNHPHFGASWDPWSRVWIAVR